MLWSVTRFQPQVPPLSHRKAQYLLRQRPQLLCHRHHSMRQQQCLLRSFPQLNQHLLVVHRFPFPTLSSAPMEP
jgi:hypothetical protein